MPVPEDFESKLELNRFVITHKTIGEESPGDLEAETARAFVQVGNKFRGTLINETVYIEYKLQTYLANNDPKKYKKLGKKTFGQQLELFRAASKDAVLQEDLEYLKELRNLLAHGKLIYEHQTDDLIIYNEASGRKEILTERLWDEIEKRVARAENSLNQLLASEQKQGSLTQ